MSRGAEYLKTAADRTMIQDLLARYRGQQHPGAEVDKSGDSGHSGSLVHHIFPLARRFVVQKIMRLCLVLAGGLLVLGCERESTEEATEEQAADTVAAAPTISLADIAGTWDMRAVPETGDTTATISQVQATPDGWTLILQDRDPIEGVVTTSGDSIVVDAGPYESVRRAGVMVTTNAVYRLEGDRLVGTVVAHYATSDADSVLRLHAEGTRAP